MNADKRGWSRIRNTFFSAFMRVYPAYLRLRLSVREARRGSGGHQPGGAAVDFSAETTTEGRDFYRQIFVAGRAGDRGDDRAGEVRSGRARHRQAGDGDLLGGDLS